MLHAMKTKPTVRALVALHLWGAVALASAGVVEVTVLDRDGRPMEDAVVALVPSAKGSPKTPLPTTAVVNQEKRQFVPSVTVVPVGAKVTFVNNDPSTHHVRVGVPGANVGDSDGQSYLIEGKSEGKPASSKMVKFDTPGAFGASLLGCYIHAAMKGTVFVAETPWTMKTGAEGLTTWDDVPDGSVSVRVWHAGLLVDKPPVSVKVNAAAPTKVTVQLDVVQRGKRI